VSIFIIKSAHTLRKWKAVHFISGPYVTRDAKIFDIRLSCKKGSPPSKTL
jgi:hypothetical protein